MTDALACFPAVAGKSPGLTIVRRGDRVPNVSKIPSRRAISIGSRLPAVTRCYEAIDHDNRCYQSQIAAATATVSDSQRANLPGIGPHTVAGADVSGDPDAACGNEGDVNAV
jgi:hypothetical protein